MIYDHCREGDRCVCGGDLPKIREGCGSWVKGTPPTAEDVKPLLDALTDEQRMALFYQYCTNCGCKDPRCQCWNDE